MAASTDDITTLAHTLSQRVAHYLERQGLLERDDENSYLALDTVDETPMDQLLGHSITYRVAVGPQQGCKAFTLQTPAANDQSESPNGRVAKLAGVSLRAGIAAEAHQRDKLESLYRYISRPAVEDYHYRTDATEYGCLNVYGARRDHDL